MSAIGASYAGEDDAWLVEERIRGRGISQPTQLDFVLHQLRRGHDWNDGWYPSAVRLCSETAAAGVSRGRQKIQR
jgi:hypothetical protein